MENSNESSSIDNPAISVIIPLYNAEKYISECLESILNQTFQNFELIVVDDCSTDNGVAVVENYIPKFNGRLKIASLEKNSGSGALPRNKGFELSQGEYVYFMDADDMLLETALEELYTLAKDFDSDFVYCERYYRYDPAKKTIKVDWMQHGDFVDKPTLETKNLTERVKGILDQRYWVTPWCKLVRRTLMIEHDIYFPHCKIAEDNVWTYGLVFYAKKFLRVPNIIYIYRESENSMTLSKRSPQQTILFWLNPILLAIKSVDKLMEKMTFFRMNPSYRYAVLEYFITLKYNNALAANLALPPYVIYDAIKQQFGKSFGEYDVSVAALCAYSATLHKMYNVNLLRFEQYTKNAEERIAELEAELNELKSTKS